jgi:hypothetical protein
MFENRGVCRIGLTSLNPMVCQNSQSESEDEKSNPIRSEKMFIKSDPMLKFVIRSKLKLLYTACVSYSMYELWTYYFMIINDMLEIMNLKISRYESDKYCSTVSHNYALYSYTSIEKTTSHIVIITMHDLQLDSQFKTSKSLSLINLIISASWHINLTN